MVESKYKDLIDKFVDETKWGFLFTEFSKYAADEGFESKIPYMRLKRRHSPIPDWQVLAPTFLQSSFSYDSLFLEKGRGSPKARRLKDAHINNLTKIFAKNKICSYARLFFEIEEDLEVLLTEKKIAKACGYNVLRALFRAKKPLGIYEIINAVDARQSGSEIRSRYFPRLLSAGFLLYKNEKYHLNPEIKEAFAHAEKIKPTVLKWKYRNNWILPWKK